MRERHVALAGKKHLQELSAVHKSYNTEISRLNKSVQENKATSLRNKDKDKIDVIALLIHYSEYVLFLFC